MQSKLAEMMEKKPVVIRNSMPQLRTYWAYAFVKNAKGKVIGALFITNEGKDWTSYKNIGYKSTEEMAARFYRYGAYKNSELCIGVNFGIDRKEKEGKITYELQALNSMTRYPMYTRNDETGNLTPDMNTVRALTILTSVYRQINTYYTDGATPYEDSQYFVCNYAGDVGLYTTGKLISYAAAYKLTNARVNGGLIQAITRAKFLSSGLCMHTTDDEAETRKVAELLYPNARIVRPVIKKMTAFFGVHIQVSTAEYANYQPITNLMNKVEAAYMSRREAEMRNAMQIAAGDNPEFVVLSEAQLLQVRRAADFYNTLALLNMVEGITKEDEVRLRQVYRYAMIWGMLLKKDLDFIEQTAKKIEKNAKDITLQEIADHFITDNVKKGRTKILNHEHLCKTLQTEDVLSRIHNIAILNNMSDGAYALLASVLEKEAAITECMKRVTARYNLQLEGLDFRLKTPHSLNVKEAERLRLNNMHADSRLNALNDCLRYTIIVEDNSIPPTGCPKMYINNANYVNIVYQLLRDIVYEATHLKELKHEVAQTMCLPEDYQGFFISRITNYWNIPQNPYNGINCTFSLVRNPAKAQISMCTLGHDSKQVHTKAKYGLLSFEVQIHTSESFEVKNGPLHKLYEESRAPGISDARAAEIQQQSMLLSRQVQRPTNVEAINWEPSAFGLTRMQVPWWEA